MINSKNYRKKILLGEFFLISAVIFSFILWFASFIEYSLEQYH